MCQAVTFIFVITSWDCIMVHVSSVYCSEVSLPLNNLYCFLKEFRRACLLSEHLLEGHSSRGNMNAVRCLLHGDTNNWSFRFHIFKDWPRWLSLHKSIWLTQPQYFLFLTSSDLLRSYRSSWMSEGLLLWSYFPLFYFNPTSEFKSELILCTWQ